VAFDVSNPGAKAALLRETLNLDRQDENRPKIKILFKRCTWRWGRKDVAGFVVIFIQIGGHKIA
jgi:hypothetical protein